MGPVPPVHPGKELEVGFEFYPEVLQVGDPEDFDEPPLGRALRASESFGRNNRAESACSCSVGWSGDPVDTANGDYSESDVDARVQENGPRLEAERTYNSLDGSSGLFGRGWSSTYDMRLAFEAGGEVSVIQGNGARVSYAPSGAPGQYEAPPRVTATLEALGGEYVFSTREPGDPIVYRFASDGSLLSIRDRNGLTTRLARPDPEALVVTGPSGRSLTYELAGGRVVSLADLTGAKTTFAYDAEGLLDEVRDPLGDVTRYGYDGSGQMTSRTDARGGELRLEYDGSGRVVREVTPAGRVTSFDYNSTPEATDVTEPDGEVVRDRYKEGFLVSRTEGVGSAAEATWSYQHDPATGGQTAIIDPDGGTTYQEFDSSGRVTKVTTPDGGETIYTYDGLGDVTSITDPEGIEKQFTYDASGNLVESEEPISADVQAVWRYEYGTGTAAGEVVKSTDPDSGVTHYSYDSAGRLETETDALGHRRTYAHDLDGRITATTLPSGAESRFLYDPAGELREAIDPTGAATTYAYDAVGDLTASTDALGEEITYAYDADGEQTALTHPDGATIRTEYGASGNVVRQTDGQGSSVVYVYDALGRVTARTDADGRTTGYRYDGDGHLVERIDPSGLRVYFQYDGEGRLLEANYEDPNTPRVQEKWDLDGRKTEMVDGTGATTYGYDLAGDLTAVHEGSESTTYSYDQMGRLTTIGYPDGDQVARTYDQAGDLTAVDDWLGDESKFRYDQDGVLVGEELPGGVMEETRLDGADRPIGIEDSNGQGPIASFDYRRDAVGRLAAAVTDGTSEEGATYDQAGRLTGFGDTSYGYDPADRPTTFDGSPQQFDPAGQLLSSSTATVNPPGTISESPPSEPTPPGSTLPEPPLQNPAQPSPSHAGTTPATHAPAAANTGTAGGEKVKLSPGRSEVGGRQLEASFSAPAGASVLAFVSVPKGRAAAAPAGGSLHWSKIASAATPVTGAVAIWHARIPSDGLSGATVLAKAVPGDGSLLGVFVLPSGATVAGVVHGSGRGNPALVLRGVEGDQILALGRGAGARVPKPADGGRLLARAVGKGGAGIGWVQESSGGTGSSTIGDWGAANSQWALVAVAVRGPGAKASASSVDGSSAREAGTMSPQFGAAKGGGEGSAGPQRSRAQARVAAVGPAPRTFRYDAEGDRTEVESSEGSLGLSYDQEGDLIRIGPSTTLGYDGGGLLRTEAVPGESTTHFTWDEASAEPLLLAKGSTSFVYGPEGQPLEQISRGEATFLLADATHSIRLLTDPAGAVVGTDDYGAYGEPRAHTGVTSALGFDGQYADPVTGYLYLRSRFYDPSTGQMLSVDPLVSLTRDPYGYADDSPLNEADPLGSFSLSNLIGQAWIDTGGYNFFATHSVGGCLSGSVGMFGYASGSVCAGVDGGYDAFSGSATFGASNGASASATIGGYYSNAVDTRNGSSVSTTAGASAGEALVGGLDVSAANEPCGRTATTIQGSFGLGAALGESGPTEVHVGRTYAYTKIIGR
jgi:RHS repeat-associated protein